jgi:hypothetical protein
MVYSPKIQYQLKVTDKGKRNNIELWLAVSSTLTYTLYHISYLDQSLLQVSEPEKIKIPEGNSFKIVSDSRNFTNLRWE